MVLCPFTEIPTGLKTEKPNPPPFILRVKRVFCSMGNKDLVDLGRLEQLFLSMTESIEFLLS